jgi:putative ubiquitin-RnfH superfamily antitoxin RatB of RatAB toxin-antitoxin module
MNVIDAKTILTSVLQGKINDSLLNVYILKDTIKSNNIQMQLKEIEFHKEKFGIQEKRIANLNTVIDDKDKEIVKLNDTINQQKKELFKQKVLKTLASIGDIALPILTLYIVISKK